MKLSTAIAQGKWEIAAHLTVIGLIYASRKPTKDIHGNERTEKPEQEKPAEG